MFSFPQTMVEHTDTLMQQLDAYRGNYCVYVLERCPLFGGCHIQVSMELGPEDIPPHPSPIRAVLISEGVIYTLRWSWDLKMCPY